MRRTPLLAAVLVAALAAGCSSSDDTLTSPSSCVPLTGLYTATFRDSCGFSTTVDVTIFQTACKVDAEVPGVGTIFGTVQGATLVFALGFTTCGGSASGTLSLTSDGGLSGSYAGQATGGGTCCGNVSGTAVFVRR